ncbi:MAG: Fmu (Sun) domain-containing protein [Ginsengibacter sp.]
MNKGEPVVQKSYVHRYLTYANSLLDNYHGNEPFHLFLKKYFSANKKHGSKDRKIISSLCYDTFRLGFGVSSQIATTEKLLLSTFLVEQENSKILEELKPEWNGMIKENILTKIDSVKNDFNPLAIFPFNDELSNGINVEHFNLSFLIQPKLFIRIRPGKKGIVLEKLKKANILFESVNDNCLAFSNSENISKLLLIDEEVVIQDYNSQRTGELLKNEWAGIENKLSVWDCCAASGGKSMLAYDLFKNIELTVSDARKNILQNLHLRFQRAGITNYTSFVADLSVPGPLKKIENFFDVIITDVPCSGSGTWSRTPEQLSTFKQKEIKRYTNLQQKIVMNALQYLKENGYLLYITCSVFKKENEENVSFFQKSLNLQLIKSEYLKGDEMQADTLFVALLKKP